MRVPWPACMHENVDMAVEPSSLSRAILRLQEAIDLYEQDPSQTIVRDGLIQRFEFTYEIATKMIKRALEEASASPAQYDEMSFATLIRSANEQGLLLGDWPRWRHYRDMRSRTSHTYDEAIALQVVADLGGFLEEAAFLRDQLLRHAS